MLYSNRQREKFFISKEVLGENLQTSIPSTQLLITLNEVWLRVVGHKNDEWIEKIKRNLALHGNGYPFYSFFYSEFEGPFQENLQTNEETFCDILESWIMLLHEESDKAASELENCINALFQRERYNKKMISGKMEPYSESIAHQGLENIWNLFISNENYKPVRDKLLESMNEYSKGKYSDSITDGGTAVQLFLEIHGYLGKTLNEQISGAIKANAIDGQKDKPLWDWLRVQRNQSGDAHPSPETSRQLAWSYLQIIGSLFERYSDEWGIK